MFQQTVTIANKTGLHARPASQLVQLCQKFKSDVTLLTGANEVNAKSIISVLSGGISAGSQVTLQTSGADETEAGAAVLELLQNLSD